MQYLSDRLYAESRKREEDLIKSESACVSDPPQGRNTLEMGDSVRSALDESEKVVKKQRLCSTVSTDAVDRCGMLWFELLESYLQTYQIITFQRMVLIKPRSGWQDPGRTSAGSSASPQQSWGPSGLAAGAFGHLAEGGFAGEGGQGGQGAALRSLQARQGGE